MDVLHVTKPPLGGERPAGVPATPAGRRTPGAAVPMRSDRTRPGAIRVLVAGGEPLMRANVAAVLGTGTGIVVVGEAETDDEALAVALRTRPDVVLIDGADGLHVLSTTRRLLADPELAGIQVLMLGRFEREEEVLAALRVGIGGLVDRDVPPYQLVRAVRMSASGAAFVVPSTTRRLIGQAEPPRAARERLDSITDRERAIVTLVARGLSDAEIAARLGIGTSTAKTHLGRAMRKLRTPDRAALVALARETGLADPPEEE
jgi:DNA-binding NarL/FixJ family response regulator